MHWEFVRQSGHRIRPRFIRTSSLPYTTKTFWTCELYFYIFTAWMDDYQIQFNASESTRLACYHLPWPLFYFGHLWPDALSSGQRIVCWTSQCTLFGTTAGHMRCCYIHRLWRIVFWSEFLVCLILYTDTTRCNPNNWSKNPWGQRLVPIVRFLEGSVEGSRSRKTTVAVFFSQLSTSDKSCVVTEGFPCEAKYMARILPWKHERHRERHRFDIEVIRAGPIQGRDRRFAIFLKKVITGS